MVVQLLGIHEYTTFIIYPLQEKLGCAKCLHSKRVHQNQVRCTTPSLFITNELYLKFVQKFVHLDSTVYMYSTSESRKVYSTFCIYNFWLLKPKCYYVNNSQE